MATTALPGAWPSRRYRAGIDAAAGPGGEVWVKTGTHVERITLRNFAHVYGGFAGTETERRQRDWARHVTVLDGDRGGSVVTAKLLGRKTSTIDRFTIRNGSGMALSSVAYGGGIYCLSSSPMIANNTISGNHLSVVYSNLGGGIYCGHSNPTIMGNTIVGNSASLGGGICCQFDGASVTIANNTIAGNFASSSGGGISSFECSPMIVNNRITGNNAGSEGGLHCWCSQARIANNTIVGNIAAHGGGLDNNNSTSSIVTNTIIAFNSSGICQKGYITSVDLRHSCVYGNTAYNFDGMPDPTGSNGNISREPLFVRLPGPGADGTWGTADDDFGDLRLLPGSPCIDAGGNGDVPADAAALDRAWDAAGAIPFDILGVPRFIDDPAAADTGAGIPPIVDMRAYEYLRGDVDGDGHVDVTDLLYLAEAFGTRRGEGAYNVGCDLDADGAVDMTDLLYLAGHFGRY